MLVLTVLILQTAAAQSNPANPANRVDQQAKMDAFIKTLSPVEEHKILHRWVGNWDVTMHMDPAKPPVGTGTIKGTMMYDGRFLFLETEGTSLGQPVKALTIVGYDVHTMRYNAVNVGGASTAMYSSSGTFDPATGALDLHGEMNDPFGKRPVRYVYILKENSLPVFEAYDTPYGKEKLIVRMTCQPAQK